jgi:hypothetical protein
MTGQDTPSRGIARSPRSAPDLKDRPLAWPGNFNHLDVKQDDNPRYEMIRKDVAHRLRKACSHLSDEEFAALVDRIVKIQLAGEGRSR